MAELEKHDIQGNIVRGYSHRRVSHLFFAIRDVGGARKFLSTLEVASAAPWPGPSGARARPDSAVNVAFSYAGLSLLRPSADVGAAFPAFEQGLRGRVALPGGGNGAARSGGNGKPHGAADAPAWEGAHLWLALYADDEESPFNERVERQLEAAARGGLELLGRLDGAILELEPDKRFEHFGFRDDLSNPEVAGAREPDDPPRPLDLGRGKLERRVLQPIRAGEFLLGYENESGTSGPNARSELGAFVRNGTFAVFLQLEQDVAGFRGQLQRLSREYGRSPEEWGALMVGRKQDGTPLCGSNIDDTLNNFGYADDRDGSRCPFGAHIRRAQPRDASSLVGGSHRLLRRGMPYGPPLAPGRLEPDGKPRGLYFVALNADLERQFEFVQKNWINGPANSGIPDDYDPLVSDSDSSRMVIQGDPAAGIMPTLVSDMPRYVSFRGGGYFFMPGLGALKALAGSAAP